MAFTGNFMCTSFKKELLFGVHDFDASTGDTFKIALYTNSATFDASTTDPTSTGTTAFTDFADETFTTATITARGALIYNTTPNTTSISVTNPTVVVLDFGSDKSSTAGDFTIVFPTADASNAIIRIA
jgi:hypothetical protein